MIEIDACRRLQQDAMKVLNRSPAVDVDVRTAIQLLGVLIERIAKETPRELARVLGSVLAEGDWGDIDPYWIECVGAVDVEDPESSHYNEVEALRAVFNRVVNHFNEG